MALKRWAKTLSSNDIGKTNSHQAGVAIPKSGPRLLSFFPYLDPEKFNPEASLPCIDPEGEHWEFRYIYYNGKTFHPRKSTRNEYRLTQIPKFLKKWNAEAGDLLVFESKEKGRYRVSIENSKQEKLALEDPTTVWSDPRLDRLSEEALRTPIKDLDLGKRLPSSEGKKLSDKDSKPEDSRSNFWVWLCVFVLLVYLAWFL